MTELLHLKTSYMQNHYRLEKDIKDFRNIEIFEA